MLLHLALSCAIVRPTPPPQRPTAVSLDRRTAVRTFGSLAALPLLTASAVAAKDKGYLTLSEYQALKQQEKAEEKLYGQFEALRLRASQTKEFDALAAKDDFTGISKLALAWDSSIRKDLLEQASIMQPSLPSAQIRSTYWGDSSHWPSMRIGCAWFHLAPDGTCKPNVIGQLGSRRAS